MYIFGHGYLINIFNWYMVKCSPKLFICDFLVIMSYNRLELYYFNMLLFF